MNYPNTHWNRPAVPDIALLTIKWHFVESKEQSMMFECRGNDFDTTPEFEIRRLMLPLNHHPCQLLSKYRETNDSPSIGLQRESRE